MTSTVKSRSSKWKSIEWLVWTFIAVFYNLQNAHAQIDFTFTTVDNSTVIVSAGTTEHRFSEISYFGPNTYWVIDGTLEIWSEKVWIASTAVFIGTGKIIFHNPGNNPYNDSKPDAPTIIDGNNGTFIGVTVELRNPNNLVLANIDDPGYGLPVSNIQAKSAALNLGGNFVFGVDYGDIILNGHDLGLSSTANLMASEGGALGTRRMIVTGRSFDGHVIKEFGSPTPIMFPIGIEEEDYTPATVTPTVAATIHIAVQDYESANVSPSDPSRGMDRVWHIISDQPVNATYTLQHNRITNGVAYVDEKAEIVQYRGSNNWSGGFTVLEGFISQAISMSITPPRSAIPTLASIHTRANIELATELTANQTWFTKLIPEEQVGPTAVDDVNRGTVCEPLITNILSNDIPGNSSILISSIRIIEHPRNGQANVNIDGSITYVPRTAFLGEDELIYQLVDVNGLTSEARLTITVEECDFKIPNVFTPDGDGINDNFQILGIEAYERVEIVVTNRWGNEVYKNNNYRNNWNGRDLLEGVYYYQIKAYKAGKAKEYVGWVLLKRGR